MWTSPFNFAHEQLASSLQWEPSVCACAVPAPWTVPPATDASVGGPLRMRWDSRVPVRLGRRRIGTCVPRGRQCLQNNLISKPTGDANVLLCLHSEAVVTRRFSPERIDKEQSSGEGAGLRLSPRKEEPGDAHSRGRPAAADLTPLDLSHLSTRGDPGHKDLAASLRASLAVHLCPYCSHQTYYPEVLWMHQRVWHRVSCTSVAPQWVQPNGHRSIRNNLVFLVRSGRTGPPPALGGRECQPLPIARFTRTQGPAGAPGPSGSCSPTAGVARATGTPRSREGHPGGPCALWTASPEGPRQTKPGHGPEQHGSPAQLPPHRPKQEAGPRPGSAGGGFSRSATPTPTVIARAGSQPPAPGRLGDKYVVPPAGAGGGPPSKHSVLEPLKAKFSPQPLGQLHAKGDGLALPASTAGPGCRGDTALQTPPTPQAARQEPPGGHEKHVDILSIFKTCIPRDFTTLYQSWGASGSAREHRGTPRTQARPGDFVCTECGKRFHQPSHLRAHMRAHSVVLESSGPRGADVLAPSADAPNQFKELDPSQRGRSVVEGKRDLRRKVSPFCSTDEGQEGHGYAEDWYRVP
ncbi:Zinc finger protein 516 [Pteropus alecto]|uniref:Zinc finger protein 516 n=1 Tax=Pteropus alecto TaxID=9402 RepID=L5KKQ5_PTEAL|nr:Zinc finger protein 516 [Pteropus alecto]